MCVALPIAFGTPFVYCADLFIFHRDARPGFGVGTAFRVAPNFSIMISSRIGLSSVQATFSISGFSLR